MIKQYNQYLITENIILSIDIIVDIIKSLDGSNNSKLVNELISQTDKQGKSMLMSIVQSNNNELVDYILKFDVDIHHTNKKGENVLYYCKNVNMFKKFYDLGVDVTVETSQNNILTYLSSKKIFNVQLYQNIIDDGVDVNKNINFYSGVLARSIYNKGIVQLLIKNGINLNGEHQHKIIESLLYDLSHYKNKRKFIINIIKLLFENGMKINNVKLFASYLLELKIYHHKEVDLISDVLIPLKKYITDDVLIAIFDKNGNVSFIQDVLSKLDDVVYAETYKWLKYRYGSHFEEYFKDYINKHPYLNGSEKFNL